MQEIGIYDICDLVRSHLADRINHAAGHGIAITIDDMARARREWWRTGLDDMPGRRKDRQAVAGQALSGACAIYERLYRERMRKHSNVAGTASGHQPRCV